MSRAVLACPYCNAEVPLEPGLPSGHRVTCPRCGEAFALRQETDVQPPHLVTNSPASHLAPASPQLTIPRRSANRRVAALVVGVMLFMAGLGLAYALLTEDFRRGNDRGLLKWRPFRPSRPDREVDPGPEEPPASPFAALGYLPADTNIMISARVRELQASAAGKQLLSERLGDGRVSLGRIEELTGLKLDDVDALALGTRADDQVAAPITAVVRTRHPYDRDKVLAALKAKPRSVARGRTNVYQFIANNMPLLFQRGLLWCADDRTVVVRLLARDFGDLPTQPKEGLGHFEEGVRELIQKRADTKAPLWAVGEVNDWSQGAPLMVPRLLELRPEDAEQLKQVRSFAGWVRPDQPVRAGAAVGCVSEAAARGLEERYLVPNKNVKGLTFTREGEWLTVSWTGDFEEVRKALGK